MTTRVAYFTAGSVGAGHFVRGVALARSLARTGTTVELRGFGAPPLFATPGLPPWSAVPLDPAGLRTRADAEASPLAAALRAFDPDVVVVDLFWAPLRHVLPTLRAEAWLLVRCCPESWFRGPPSLPFEPAVFTRILAIEPCPLPIDAERLDPVVVCNTDEVQPAGALRRLLEVPSGARLSVAVHAGREGELAQLLARSEPDTRALDLAYPEAPFPAASWLADADRIYAGAGYNTFWEAQWLGYAARTTFVPFTRRIDDQAWRARLGAAAVMKANGADTLARWLVAG